MLEYSKRYIRFIVHTHRVEVTRANTVEHQALHELAKRLLQRQRRIVRVTGGRTCTCAQPLVAQRLNREKAIQWHTR